MKLDDYLSEFEGLDAEERLETLMDFSGTLPPLSAEYMVRRARGECRIQECQTEVYLYVAIVNGAVELAAYVPEQSPTVRGFVAMLVNGLNGSSPQEVLAIPDNMPEQLKLQSVLGMTRYRGFMGVVSVLKRRVREAITV